MEQTGRGSDARLTMPSWRAHLCAMFGVATLAVVTGCTYGAATQQPQSGDPLARLKDSLSTSASVDLGYVSQPRGTITGAVSSLSLADGSRRPHVRSLADLLQGRIAGLSVENTRGGVSMRVRGGGGDIGAAPLVVIDGDPLPSGAVLERMLQSINPADVVRVDVLKDVSATAIYGTRGSGGVVLITLRHGAR